MDEKKIEKVLAEVDHINGMKYEKSRKERALKIKPLLKDVEVICGAVERSKGKICTKPPEEGSLRCAQHGGLSTGARTEEGAMRALANLDPRARVIHGMYSRFIMTEEETSFYVLFMNHYVTTLELDPANILLLDRALRNFILNQRKEVAEAGEMIDESNSYNDYDTKFMRYIQSLGLDRKFNESKENKNNKSESMDIAMLFLNE